MTTYLGKSCSFGLPRVPFVNCRQFMYLVISLLVLRAGYRIWLYQFLIIAYLFTLQNVLCQRHCVWYWMVLVKWNIRNRKVCNKKNQTWVFVADRKFRPSESLFCITRHSLVMPNSDPRDGIFDLHLTPCKIRIISSFLDRQNSHWFEHIYLFMYWTHPNFTKLSYCQIYSRLWSGLDVVYGNVFFLDFFSYLWVFCIRSV